MRTVVFENPGEIDPVAIRTFGVNVKETENPIGFFGTGLKYALSILLRTNHQVVVFSGTRRIEFALQEVTVRGEKFQLITMDGEPLGFTTRLGVNWKMWMAYRELHCNCADERGITYEVRSFGDLEPTTDKTLVCVTGEEFAQVHDNRYQFLIDPNREKLGRVQQGLQVYRGKAGGYFYKGVVVHMPERLIYAFGYELTNYCELSEDRVAMYPMYDHKRFVTHWLQNCTNKELLREVLTCDESFYKEGAFDYDAQLIDPSDAFRAVVEKLVSEKISKVNQSAIKAVERYNKARLSPKPVELSIIEQKQLDKAIGFCKALGFMVDEFPITVVESLGTGTLGIAKNQQTFLAREVFDQGTKRVAGTLIEEWVHIRHSLYDCTREMQNFLLDRMVGLGERVRGEPL